MHTREIIFFFVKSTKKCPRVVGELSKVRSIDSRSSICLQRRKSISKKSICQFSFLWSIWPKVSKSGKSDAYQTCTSTPTDMSSTFSHKNIWPLTSRDVRNWFTKVREKSKSQFFVILDERCTGSGKSDAYQTYSSTPTDMSSTFSHKKIRPMTSRDVCKCSTMKGPIWPFWPLKCSLAPKRVSSFKFFISPT